MAKITLLTKANICFILELEVKDNSLTSAEVLICALQQMSDIGQYIPNFGYLLMSYAIYFIRDLAWAVVHLHEKSVAHHI